MPDGMLMGYNTNRQRSKQEGPFKKKKIKQLKLYVALKLASLQTLAFCFCLRVTANRLAIMAIQLPRKVTGA